MYFICLAELFFHLKCGFRFRGGVSRENNRKYFGNFIPEFFSQYFDLFFSAFKTANQKSYFDKL